VRQQRQRARFAGGIAQNDIGKTGLEPEFRPAGGALDRMPHLVGPHRTEENLLGGNEPRQPFMRGAVSVEIRAQGDHDLTLVLEEAVEELPPCRVVVAKGESLFELIDDEQLRIAIKDRIQRSRGIEAGSDQGRRVDRCDLAPARGRDQPRADERRLPASGCAHQRKEAAPGEAFEHASEYFFTAEEETLVLWLEGEQAAVRAILRRRRGAQGWSRYSEDVLTLAGAAKLVRAEIDQAEPGLKMVSDEPGGHLR